MSNKHCRVCEHLQTFGTDRGPYTWHCCDEIKKSLSSDTDLYMSYSVLEIRPDALETFYCKHFTRKEKSGNG